MGDTEQRDDHEQTKNSEQSEKNEQNEQNERSEPESEAPKITHDTVETDPVRKVINKKLSTMSRETKEGKKNRKRVLKNQRTNSNSQI